MCERVPDFSLIDLKWRPDVPFNHQVSSVFFWISLSPANPILSQREREGDIDMDMDRQCHIMYSMHVDRYWPPTGPSTSLGGGWLLSTLRATILSLLSCTYCSVRTHLYQYLPIFVYFSFLCVFAAWFHSSLWSENYCEDTEDYFSVWTNSKFWPNRIPEYYSHAIFYRIEYTNNSDLIIRIIRIIHNTFKRLKLVQILPKKLKIHRYLIMFT